MHGSTHLSRWDQHWFGPTAAIRPYLFQKCFTLMVAFDLLVLMVERGARYGADAVSFNVPHFAWLHSLHLHFLPDGVPTATYYVGILTLTSFLAFCLFFGGHRPWLMAIVCGLFTYAWAMSRLDSYLHHYMLSLIMFCMIFFPAIDARLLESLPSPTKDKQAKRKAKAKQDSNRDSGNGGTRVVLMRLASCLLVLALAYRICLSGLLGLNATQRWSAMLLFFAAAVGAIAWAHYSLPRNKSNPRPWVRAWSFRTLLTTVGVIYIFAGIAKMDAEWCGGHTLKTVGATEQVLQPVAQIAASLGIQVDTFWSLLATLVIPLEIGLGLIYIVSVYQDEPDRVWLPRLCTVGWLLGVGLHLNNEMMNLIIQWFGYYMLLMVTVLLLPSRVLWLAGQVFVVPECWVRNRLENACREEGPTLTAVGIAALATIPAAVVLAMLSMIPGVMISAITLLAIIVCSTAVGIALGWMRGSFIAAATAAIAFFAMTCAIAQSSMQFDYYDLSGKTLMSQGRTDEAVSSLEAATAFRAPSSQASAELLTNLAICYVRAFGSQPNLDPIDQESWIARIERTFRQAIADDPRQFLACYSYGNFLASQDRLAEAQQQFRAALAIKPDFSDAYVNLGNTFEYSGNLQEARACYAAAAKIEPYAQDIQQLLTQVNAKLASDAEQEIEDPQE